MRETILKGNTPDEKLKHAEIILSRMSRRLHKTVVFVSPASVLSGYVKELPEDGIVLRCLFPCGGVLKGVTTTMDAEKKNSIISYITVGNITYKNHDSEIQIKPGEKLEVRLEGICSNIYVSALFIADATVAKKEALAIASLDKASEEV